MQTPHTFLLPVIHRNPSIGMALAAKVSADTNFCTAVTAFLPGAVHEGKPSPKKGIRGLAKVGLSENNYVETCEIMRKHVKTSSLYRFSVHFLLAIG